MDFNWVDILEVITSALASHVVTICQVYLVGENATKKWSPVLLALLALQLNCQLKLKVGRIDRSNVKCELHFS